MRRLGLVVFLVAARAHAGDMCSGSVEALGEDGARALFTDTCADVRYLAYDFAAGRLLSGPTLHAQDEDWRTEPFPTLLKAVRAGLTPLAADAPEKLACDVPRKQWKGHCAIPAAGGQLECDLDRLKSPWTATCTLTVGTQAATTTVKGVHGPFKARLVRSARHPDVRFVILTFPDENHVTLSWDRLLVLPVPAAAELGAKGFAALLPAPARAAFTRLAARPAP